MGRTSQEIMTARDTLIFLLENLGFVMNLKKAMLHPVKNWNFWVTDKYRGNDTVSLRRKTGSYNSTMSGGLLSAQNFSVKFDKINWPTFVNGLSYIAWENSILFSPTGANVKSEKVGELPGVCYSW